MVTELDFRKKLFAADFGQKRPEKEVFEDFFEVASKVFSDFVHKDGHLNTLECDGTQFLRNIFSRLILAKNGWPQKEVFDNILRISLLFFQNFYTKLGILIPTNATEPDC